MQTNTRAIVSATLAVLILIIKNFVPSIAEPLDLIASPLADIIVALLALFAGVNTAVPALGIQKVV